MIIKQEVRLYKLDENGFFEDYERMELDFDTETTKIINIPQGYVEYSWMHQNPEQRWFTPKYDFELGRWVESLTNEEIEEYNKPVEKEKEVKNEEIKKQLLDLQNYIISKEYVNLINVGGKSNAL
ncbi:hypothetical protein [Hathewaya histolytica]|uniref:Uncharacterized protein n=1 Tax=Hathewaya histolytica TaxID=1498 RepID=A0A4U9RE59_HATHI|nr:hypothetical protein [Hathewaya histolytica]VTQ87040.1 Uncharacterised protein [Hathewaya histolytica]